VVGGENLLRVPTFLSGIVDWLPVIQSHAIYSMTHCSWKALWSEKLYMGSGTSF